MSNKLIHTRYVAGSSLLLKFLEELGYSLEYTKKVNTIKQIWLYISKDGEKYVKVTFHYMELYTMEDNKKKVHYKGYTIHDELLKFFTNRDLISIKND